MMFDEIMSRWTWRPIRNCPGRYVLSDGAVAAPPQQIVPDAIGVTEQVVARAKDPVIVSRFEDGGGLISYRKADGRYLHTLNTREGFQRKLQQLGIR